MRAGCIAEEQVKIVPIGKVTTEIQRSEVSRTRKGGKYGY